MRSIRKHLTSRLLLGTGALLFLFVSSIGGTVYLALLRSFDQALEAKARTLATLTSLEGRKIEIEFAGEYMPEFEEEDDPEYFQFLLQDGSVVERSGSLGGGKLPLIPGRSANPTFQNLRLPDGRRGRMIQVTFPPRSEDEDLKAKGPDNNGELLFELPAMMDVKSVFVTLLVARGRRDLDLTVVGLFLVLATLSALFLGGVWFIVRSSISEGFAPITELNEQIGDIDTRSLATRICPGEEVLELASIVNALNSLLARLGETLQRERRFSSDVAHELRTPVAELRTLCEVGERCLDDPDTTRQFFEDVGDVSSQMESMVANLLLLARCDSQTDGISIGPVDVPGMVQTLWDSVSVQKDAVTTSIRNRVQLGLVIMSDQSNLEQIVRNLLSNAATYSKPNALVNCFDRVTPDGVDLIFENHTERINKDDLEHVFERFWRKDQSHGDAAHSGLGLSLAKALADRLDIEMKAEWVSPDIFRATLSFKTG